MKTYYKNFFLVLIIITISFLIIQNNNLFFGENISNTEKGFQVDRYGKVSFDAKKNLSNKGFHKDFYEYLGDRDYQSFSILHAEKLPENFFLQLSQYRPSSLFLSYSDFSQKNILELQQLEKIQSLVDIEFNLGIALTNEQKDDFFDVLNKIFSKKEKMGTIKIYFEGQNYLIPQDAFLSYSQLPFAHFESNIDFNSISQEKMLEFLKKKGVTSFQHSAMKYEKTSQGDIFEYQSSGEALINGQKHKQNPEGEYKKIE